MTPFEEELKQALTRSEPSADFTERVLQRQRAQPARRMADWEGKIRFWSRGRVRWPAPLPGIQTGAPVRRRPVWHWAAAAAAALLLTTTGAVYQQHEQRVRGLAAKDKLLIAMRVAGSKLQQAQEQVRQAESPEVNQ